jgi:hypothetical protein
MPCSDPRDDDVPSYYHGLEDKCDNLTDMLCGIMRIVEKDGGVPYESVPRLETWWASHKASDVLRLLKANERLTCLEGELKAANSALKFMDTLPNIPSHIVDELDSAVEAIRFEIDALKEREF